MVSQIWHHTNCKWFRSKAYWAFRYTCLVAPKESEAH